MSQKIQIEFELEDLQTLFVWREHDKKTFTPKGLILSTKLDLVIDKIADQVEPIIDKME